MPGITRQIHATHAALAKLAIYGIAVGDGTTEIEVSPRLAAAFDLEQLVDADTERLEHPDPCASGRERMLAVDDLRPVTAREPELESPVVLAEGAPGNQVEESPVLEADAQTMRLWAGDGEPAR